jgi:hypothetical protein
VSRVLIAVCRPWETRLGLFLSDCKDRLGGGDGRRWRPEEDAGQRPATVLCSHPPTQARNEGVATPTRSPAARARFGARVGAAPRSFRDDLGLLRLVRGRGLAKLRASPRAGYVAATSLASPRARRSHPAVLGTHPQKPVKSLISGWISDSSRRWAIGGEPNCAKGSTEPSGRSPRAVQRGSSTNGAPSFELRDGSWIRPVAARSALGPTGRRDPWSPAGVRVGR